MTTDQKNKSSKIDTYDDEKHFYEDFWVGRDYEHFAEVIAIRKLLKDRHFEKAMDLGGGYGRLSFTLLDYTDSLVLAEPSKKQIDIAKKKLKDYKHIDYMLLKEEHVIPSKDNSLDFIMMIRVSHHIVDPAKTFAEISRVLKPGALAIIEVANNSHALNKIRYASQLKGVPSEPVRIGKVANGIEDETTFVNHNAKTIEKQMATAGFKIEKKLSVSNFRNKKLKNTIGMKNLLMIEGKLQQPLSSLNFGPSMFYLVKNSY